MEKGKGREMGAAIFVDNLGIGPGNAPAILREEARVARGLVWGGAGRCVCPLAHSFATHTGEAITAHTHNPPVWHGVRHN